MGHTGGERGGFKNTFPTFPLNSPYSLAPHKGSIDQEPRVSPEGCNLWQKVLLLLGNYLIIAGTEVPSYRRKKRERKMGKGMRSFTVPMERAVTVKGRNKRMSQKYCFNQDPNGGRRLHLKESSRARQTILELSFF